MPNQNHNDDNSKNDDISTVRLEPRVAKLEVGLDRLTDDVRSLAQVVREQGIQMEQEVQKLVVAVTQAAGPRKTDWSTIIAALMLVMAIGSAVFWPLNQTSRDSKLVIENLERKFDNHTQLQLHPVGMALVSRIEEQLQFQSNKFSYDLESYKKYVDDLINRQEKLFLEHIGGALKSQNLVNEWMHNKILKLEEQNQINNERDKNELQLWRRHAMGLIDNSTIYQPHLP